MKERDYLNVQEHTRIKCAIEILQDIITENSETITSKQKREIMESLHQWKERLYNIIKITDN